MLETILKRIPQSTSALSALLHWLVSPGTGLLPLTQTPCTVLPEDRAEAVGSSAGRAPFLQVLVLQDEPPLSLLQPKPFALTAAPCSRAEC